MRRILSSGRPAILAPQLGRLVVLGVDRDQQAVLGQAELARDQVPGELDGEVLEVVAEGEVAEHLEEGVVARGIADVLQVVVLAAGAHALLRGDGAAVVAGLGAGEDVLELHHAGVGEQQRRVVVGNQRRGGHDLVTVGLEVVKKVGADLVGAVHGIHIVRSRRAVPACGPSVRFRRAPQLGRPAVMRRAGRPGERAGSQRERIADALARAGRGCKAAQGRETGPRGAPDARLRVGRARKTGGR